MIKRKRKNYKWTGKCFGYWDGRVGKVYVSLSDLCNDNKLPMIAASVRNYMSKHGVDSVVIGDIVVFRTTIVKSEGKSHNPSDKFLKQVRGSKYF